VVLSKARERRVSKDLKTA